MELATIFKLLKRRWWILILVPIVAAVAAYLVSLGIERNYRSSALLATGFTTNEGIQIKDERVDLWGAGVKFDNMIEKMNSELVLALLTYNLVIHDLTSPKPYRVLKDKENLLVGKSKEDINLIVARLQEKADKMELLSVYNEGEEELIDLTEEFGYAGWMLRKHLSINRARSSDFVEVSYLSENPFLSADVVNILSEQFIRYDSYQRFGSSSESVKFFADLAEEKKKILDEKINFLDRFKTINNLYGDDFTDLKSSQIVDYEVLRQEKLDEINSKKLLIKDIDNQLRTLDATGTESVADINAKILQTRSKINELNLIYTNGGSTDQELSKTIASLRKQLQSEMNKLVVESPVTGAGRPTTESLLTKRKQLELELDISNANLESLNQAILGLKSSVSASVSKKSSIEALTREVNTASQEYLQAIEKYNEEKNKSLLSKSSISISQRGQPNGSPESSKRLLIIGFSGMASLSLCIFVIILVEFIDQRLKNPAKFETFTNLKLIGSVNLIKESNFDLKTLFTQKIADKSIESLRQFLRKIRFEVESSEAQVILVTSTKTGEGKTFMILSLAYSLSLLNKRALIIDTNFRNNSLTRLLINRPSLQKMLQEDTETKLLSNALDQPGEKSANIIYRTENKNIDVIGSNAGPESPSEILADRNFHSMIDKLRKNYSYILMEGASLNEFSDTKELLMYADKLIAVFSAESTLQAIDKESIDFINSLNGKFLGAVLNKLDMEHIN
jgi:polysaccharide biosynthesis transport protein